MARLYLTTGKDYRGMVRSALYGDPAEPDFFDEVETCLRKHYTVKRVTAAKGVKK